MQAFTCLEGPVLECYENEVITIGNPAYPTRDTIQHLVDDFMFAFVFMASKGKKQQDQEGDPDNAIIGNNGHAPEILLPLDQSNIGVRLIHDTSNKSTML